MSRNTELENFENMLKLAEIGIKLHHDRRSVIFRIFVSYTTLLVVIAGLLMKHSKDEIIESNVFEWSLTIFLLAMLLFYIQWLITFYRASAYDVRRRDFYIIKAEVISYHMSEYLSNYYSDCKKRIINLAPGGYKISEKRLFKKRHPDIDPKVNRTAPCEPKIIKSPHFWFNLVSPVGLTILIVIFLIQDFIILSVMSVVCILIVLMSKWKEGHASTINSTKKACDRTSADSGRGSG